MARIIDTDNKNLIGNKVKLLRKKKHMSQQQLSDNWKHWPSISVAVPFPELKTAVGQLRILNCTVCLRCLQHP